MADADSSRRPDQRGRTRHCPFETGKLAQLGRRRSGRPTSATPTLLSTVATQQAPRGHRLLPADGRRRGADVRRGQDPRLVLPSRRSSGRAGDPDLPAHRPAAAPVVPRGLPQRGPGHRHRSSAPTMVNPHDIVSINGASAALMVSGIPFDGPIGAVRIAHHRRRVGRPPDLPGGRRVDLRDRRRRVASSDDGDIADHDGRGRRHRGRAGSSTRPAPPKITEETIAEGLEWSKQWIGASDRPPARARADGAGGSTARSTTIAVRAHGRLPARRVRRGRRRGARRTRREAMKHRRQERAQPPARRDPSTRASPRSSAATTRPARSPAARRRSKAAFRSLQKQVVRDRIVDEGVRIDGRGVTDLRPLSAEVGILADGARHRPVPAGRDAGADASPTLGMPRMEQMRRHHRRRRPQALHAPLQLPAVLHR